MSKICKVCEFSILLYYAGKSVTTFPHSGTLFCSTQFLVFPISTRVDITVYQHGKCFIFLTYSYLIVRTSYFGPRENNYSNSHKHNTKITLTHSRCAVLLG